MIVPDYWAEARRQHRSHGKQVTVRRFGWSTESAADALAMAELRADEALHRILTGEKLDRREPKVPYNGADGIPIREEVLARHGDVVITRNAYGARCLNSPNALFADIDFELEFTYVPALITFSFLLVGCAYVGFGVQSWSTTFTLLLVSLIATASFSGLMSRMTVAARGGAEHLARERLVAFLSHHPSWNVRLYRTPAGIRLLATHQTFDAGSQEVQEFFASVHADPTYVRMCQNQRCFRARLTAKPWRIGISTHMRPRPGTWPVRPERMPDRNEWIVRYEARARDFAACQFVESLGSGLVIDALTPVIDLHDRESGALVLGAKMA